MWAPDAACRGGRYYLYFPARDAEGVFRIGVATADRPQGPFTPEPAPIPGSFSIDPCVFPDHDGQFYLAFGGVWGGQLPCWTTGAFVKDAVTPADDRPALCPRNCVKVQELFYDPGRHRPDGPVAGGLSPAAAAPSPG